MTAAQAARAARAERRAGYEARLAIWRALDPAPVVTAARAVVTLAAPVVTAAPAKVTP